MTPLPLGPGRLRITDTYRAYRRHGRFAAIAAGYGHLHGWLTGEETQELAERLWALPLPAYEPTFEAMEGAHRSFPATAAVRHDWEALSLSFVRTVATIAAHEGKGALWGDDLLSWGNDVLSWER